MGVTPSSPNEIGIFFEYPSGSSTAGVGAYWLAANGHNVRMTPQCRTALLASFEALLERAVAPVNVGSTLNTLNELSVNDLGGATRDFTIIDLQPWSSASYRAGLKNKFKRGCPKEDWDNFVRFVWSMWNSSGKTIQANGSNFTFMGWQSWPFQLDTQGWIEAPLDVYVAWVYDVGTAACDFGYTEHGEQEYAPWGQYTGSTWPDGRVSQWAIGGFEALGCTTATTGTPSYYYFVGTGGDELFTNGTGCLGMLSSGYLGNWTNGSTSTSIRRSSTGWAVFQSMLANMKYSHIRFDHSTQYNNTEESRIYQREFYFDPYDANFYLLDYSYYDSSSTRTTRNLLESGSYISHAGSGVAVGLTFGIMKGSELEASLVLDAPPEDYVVDINGKDYLIYYRDQLGGTNQVEMHRYMTDTVISSSTTVVEPYPASAFIDYAQCGRVSFIDCKSDGSQMYPATYRQAWRGWTENGVQPGQLLSAAVNAHGRRLLSEIASPRTWAQPQAISDAAISRASDTWWSNWKLVYPDSPNWPPYEAQQGTATQYFPSHLQNPHGERKAWVEDGDRWKCEHGDVFGNFELAFPDYPFGWANEEMHTINQYDEAVAPYTWTFKTMPTS